MDTKAVQQSSFYPPVVAVLGHVDHGKTTLLDAIRSSSIAQREFGGITQKIGASSVELVHEGAKRSITFIDTPGHEAFSKMRSRGAQAADIGLLIVSAVDGIMPQTRESLRMLQEAKIPFIAVLTFSDMPTKNPEKVKQQLMHEGVLLEEYGGEVPVIEVSAKTNLHIKELLDLILLVAELNAVNEGRSAQNPLEAIVIESKLDQKAGPKATVVIKNGTLTQREEVFCEGEGFKVRTLITDTGAQLPRATVGTAVELLGMKHVLGVGSMISGTAQPVAALPPMQTDGVYSPNAPESGLAIILVADTQGSLEAITYALPEEVYIISQKTGEVTEGDVLLAKSTGAIVLSFNVKIRPDVQKLAVTEKVLARNYHIIYEMLDEIKDVLEGKRLAALEEIYGTARILAKFPFEKTFAAGINVMDGRVAKGDRIRILREEEVVGEATIASLRIGKNPTSKVEKGKEAGIILNPSLDFSVGDVIISHS